MMERVWRRLGSGGGGETCPNCLGDVTWTDRGHLRRCEICGQIAETAAAN